MEMTPACRAFLMQGTRTGKLATIRADGRPHIVPIWFVVDGDTLVFMTEETTVKARNMRHDAHVSLCVDDQSPPYAYAAVEGIASLTENDPDLLHWSTVIGGRYMGEARAEEFGRRNATPEELLVRITPTKVIFKENISD